MSLYAGAHRALSWALSKFTPTSASTGIGASAGVPVDWGAPVDNGLTSGSSPLPNPPTQRETLRFLR
jgi:hypothetical protein